jgi:hypothetical protein
VVSAVTNTTRGTTGGSRLISNSKIIELLSSAHNNGDGTSTLLFATVTEVEDPGDHDPTLDGHGTDGNDDTSSGYNTQAPFSGSNAKDAPADDPAEPAANSSLERRSDAEDHSDIADCSNAAPMEEPRSATSPDVPLAPLLAATRHTASSSAWDTCRTILTGCHQSLHVTRLLSAFTAQEEFG